MSGIITTETEITVYAQVGDFNGFKEAKSVSNIQELIHFVEGKGKFRARKIADGNGTTYTAGIKTIGKGDTVKMALDQEDPVSAAYFEAFRYLADHLTVRDRFIFEGSTASISIGDKDVALPPIDYMVDVFHRFDGRESNVIKIDIEVNKIREALRSMGQDPDNVTMDIKISHLPFKPVGAFISGDNNTPEQTAQIKEMWVVNRQSPFGGPMQEITASVDSNQNKSPVTPSGNQTTTPEGNSNGEAHV